MKKLLLFLPFLFFLTGCGSSIETITPGRGAASEVGPMAKVYPQGAPARMARHGIWRGVNGDQVVWELRYTRGLPSGPYREWDATGNLIATWPYNWEGKVVGWARWFREGKPDGKIKITLESHPDFEVVGNAAGFKKWMQQQVGED